MAINRQKTKLKNGLESGIPRLLARPDANS
jgi:hypothetical protein